MPFGPPFNIDPYPIGALLSSSKFEIPALQRPFAWSAEQANDLVSDLRDLLEQGNGSEPTARHFFGMIVVLQGGERDQIIDGQQRLTTITTLLAGIESEYRALAASWKEEATRFAPPHNAHLLAIAASADTEAESIKNRLWFNAGFQQGQAKVSIKPRLQVSPEVEGTYRSILEGTIDSKSMAGLPAPANNLRNIHKIFRDALIAPKGFVDLEPREQFQHLYNLTEVVTDGLIVVRMGTSGALAGFELFETLNARGLDLNSLDLLKVWILAEFAANGLDDSDIARRLSALSNNNADLQNEFFRQFCILRSTLREKDGSKLFAEATGVNDAKDKVRKARQHVFLDESIPGVPKSADPVHERISVEVALMERLTPHWEALTGKRRDLYQDDLTPGPYRNLNVHKRLSSSLVHLKEELGLQQAYPYMMHWSDGLTSRPDDFAHLVTEFERFFFRYKTICGNTPAKVLKVLVGISRRLSSPAGLDVDWLDSYLSDVVGEGADDKQFRSDLSKKLGYGGAATKRTRYLLFMLARRQWVGPLVADQLHIAVSDTGPKGEKWTLEHIYPQNPAPGVKRFPDELVHSIGNLCLLNPQINTQLGNLSFKEKCEKAKALKKQKRTIYVADSASIFYDGSEDWTEKKAAQRERKIIDEAMDFFRF